MVQKNHLFFSPVFDRFGKSIKKKRIVEVSLVCTCTYSQPHIKIQVIHKACKYSTGEQEIAHMLCVR